MTETQNELELLKERADMMGIKYAPNVGVETLKKRIDEKLNGTKDPEEALSPEGETQEQQRARLIREANELVRVRITNLNPTKRDLPGEIFTVANDVIGVVKCYVPYDEAGQAWHLPAVIYENLKNRQFFDCKTREVKGKIIKTEAWVPEFNLEILPPLTQKELDELAAAQARAGAID